MTCCVPWDIDYPEIQTQHLHVVAVHLTQNGLRYGLPGGAEHHGARGLTQQVDASRVISMVVRD